MNLVKITLILLLVTACATDGEENASNEEFANSNNLNAAAVDEGEGINNATEEESEGGLANQNAQGNQAINSLNSGEGINNASEGDMFLAATNSQVPQTPVEQPAVDTSVSPEVDAAVPVEAGPATTPTFSSGGLVRYVRQDNVSVYDSPSGGAPVSTLEQGDHPLVTIEGVWARNQDGHYISTSDLSEKGISRRRKPVTWR